MTEPTCTEQGYTTYTCHCNDSYIADYVDELGHTEVIDNAVASTCTETGLTEGKHCSVCEEVLIAQEVVEATGHDYEEVVTEPTCTEQGYTTYTCHCGDSYVDNYVDALGHTEGEVVIENNLPPTCTKVGSFDNVIYCAICNEEITRDTIIVKANGHDYVSVITAPTCTEQGYTTYTCHCGDSYVDNYVGALGHTEVIDNAIASTCTETGLTEGKHCSVCKEVLIAQEVVEATGHDYVSVITAPTCTEQGYTTYTCHCNHSYIDNYVDALGHTEVIDNAVASTCTETGLTEGKHCSVCEEILIAQEVVEENGHDYESAVTASTCTEQGYTIYTCHCNHSYIDNYVDALGHTEIIDNAVEPTCTETGLTEGKHCSVCKEVLIAQEIVEATGHDYEDVVTEPMCTEQGYTTYTCHCNDSYIDDYVDALGHNAGETVVENNVLPKCTETGSYDNVVYCLTCEDELSRETIVVDELGHTEVVDNAVNATFSSPGLTAGSHCSVCNEVIVAQIEIPSLGLDADSEQGIVASPEYSDVEEGVSYRYSYSLNIKHDDSFVLTTLTIGSDETYSLNYSSGKISNISNGIHELIFDDGRDSMYIRFIDNKFEFCKRDGSKWDKEKYERPEGVTTVDLVPRLGNSTYGYYDLANNVHGESMQELYRRMFYACEAFVNNTDDIQSTNGFYILDTIDLSHYIINVNEVIATWKVFIVENPRYYWLSNRLTVDGSNLKFCIDEAYSKADYRAQCDAAIDNMLEECNALINEGMSELEIALTVHDFIINRMDYAYESDGVTPQDDIWAHNMVGCAKYNLGVCESFAETFMYLCRLNDVEAIIVTGTANNESHAWNIVKIDGVWYGVDVTWDETNEEGLISYNCFGMSRQYCDSTHNADSFDKTGVNYLYQLPDMSESSIELVDLLKNGEFVGTYVSIDKAFEYMTDQNADYTLQLYSYTLQGPLLISSPSIIHNIYSTETPDVKSITIKGQYENLGNGYGTCTSLVINDYLTLLADTLVLYNIALRGDDALYIQDNCLDISGRGSVAISIIGNIDGCATSKIVCNTAIGVQIEFWKEIQVYEMDAPGQVTFRGATKITHLKSRRVDVYGGSLNVENLHGIYEGCDVWLENMGGANIQNIHSDINDINIYLKFGKLEEFPFLSLGDVSCNIKINLHGTVHYVITDIFGNEIGSYKEDANPFNVTRPIAHLLQSSKFEKISICYANSGNKTSLYFVDSNGDIILKQYENKDGLIIMDGIIVNYEGTAATLNIPEGVTAIGHSAFYLCSSLTSVKIPSSVINVDEYAFYGCWNLTNITIPNSVTSIGDYAFANCSSLTNVIIGDNVINIGSMSFYNCSALTSVIMGDSVTIIGSNAFSGCNALTIYCSMQNKPSGWGSLSCPIVFNCENNDVATDGYIYTSIDGVRYGIKGDKATVVCQPKNIITANIRSTITYKGNNYDVTNIGSSAFSWCDEMINIIIPDSIISISSMSFFRCTSLENVYYTGTAEDWSKISISSNNSDLTSATIYYYIENASDLPSDNGNYWHYVDGVPTPWTTTEE